MALTPSMMWVYVLLILIAWQVFQNITARKKIHCTFIRRDRTRVVKWAKDDEGRIEFEGGWYEVRPDYTILQLMWNPLPMWARTLLFRWDSSKPLNPASFDNQYLPEERKRLDASDSIRAYQMGTRQAMQQSSSQQSMLQKFQPIILIAGFAVLGIMLWKLQGSMNQVGIGQNLMESQLQQVINALNKLP